MNDNIQLRYLLGESWLLDCTIAEMVFSLRSNFRSENEDMLYSPRARRVCVARKHAEFHTSNSPEYIFNVLPGSRMHIVLITRFNVTFKCLGSGCVTR